MTYEKTNIKEQYMKNILKKFKENKKKIFIDDDWEGKIQIISLESYKDCLVAFDERNVCFLLTEQNVKEVEKQLNKKKRN